MSERSSGILGIFPDLGVRTQIVGVLNVTPDSFSDGGRFLETDRAVEHGRALVRAGADLIDVGGDSTRPGSEGVSAEVELERVLPVIRALAKEGVKLSIDTSKALVAARALEVGPLLPGSSVVSLANVAKSSPAFARARMACAFSRFAAGFSSGCAAMYSSISASVTLQR